MKKLLLIIVFPLILSGCVSGLGIGGGGGGPKADGEFVEGAIVAGFPGVPSYPEATVIESYGSKEGNFGASLITKDKLAKVVNFFGTALPARGWKNSLKQNSDTNYEYEISGNTHKGRVIINTAADGKSTAISISLEPR